MTAFGGDSDDLFWKGLALNVRERPEAAAVADAARSFAFAELDVAAGRVAAHLAAKAAVKRRYVLVRTPRDARGFVAMLGVLRAGAAFVVCEEALPSARIDFIRGDCGAACSFDVASEWDAAMAREPVAGIGAGAAGEPGYAVYTSGSTGRPKGVAHARGTLDLIVLSCRDRGENIWRPGSRHVSIGPLGTASTVITFAGVLAQGGCVWVPSADVAPGARGLASLFAAARATHAFIPPSLARLVASEPSLPGTVIVGSEPCEGLRLPGRRVYDFYASSETGFVALMRRLDAMGGARAAARPPAGIRTFVDDGEVCVCQPHFLGYVNGPDETARKFRGGILRTGDSGRVTEDGGIVVTGRLDEMLKVGGWRIEPGEIERTFLDVCPCSWACARVFATGCNNAIAVYHDRPSEKGFDAAAVRAAMAARLPARLVPSHFVYVREPPLLPNGKTDRLALPPPPDGSGDGAASGDEIEAMLLRAFASALGTDSVGPQDDVFALGLDSIGAVEAAIGCGLEGMDSIDIFAGRTPARIASLYRASRLAHRGEDRERLDAEARERAWPLTPAQRCLWDYAAGRDGSTADNVSALLRFGPDDVAPEALAAAVERVFAHHPACRTVIERQPDGPVQRLGAEPPVRVPVERLGEAELERLKPSLVRPFALTGARLCRARVFATGEATYLFVDLHHLLFDGYSAKLIVTDIARTVRGDRLEPDRYYLHLAEARKTVESGSWAAARAWFDARYGAIRDRLPRIDRASSENECVEFTVGLDGPGERPGTGRGSLFRGQTEFFVAAGLLALAAWNRVRSVVVSWTFHGRTTAEKRAMAGMLIADLPVAADFTDALSVGAFAADLREQMIEGKRRSHCPWTALESGAWPSPWKADFLEILSLGELYEEGLPGLPFDLVELPQGHDGMDNCLQIEIHGGGAAPLALRFCYLSSVYGEATRRDFAGLYVRACRRLSEAASDPGAAVIGLLKSLEAGL